MTFIELQNFVVRLCSGYPTLGTIIGTDDIIEALSVAQRDVAYDMLTYASRQEVIVDEDDEYEDDDDAISYADTDSQQTGAFVQAQSSSANFLKTGTKQPTLPGYCHAAIGVRAALNLCPAKEVDAIGSLSERYSVELERAKHAYSHMKSDRPQRVQDNYNEDRFDDESYRVE